MLARRLPAAFAFTYEFLYQGNQCEARKSPEFVRVCLLYSGSGMDMGRCSMKKSSKCSFSLAVLYTMPGSFARRAFMCLVPALLCLLVASLPLFVPVPAHADGDSAVFSARREFKGFVRRDMAERAARLAAELAAFEQAARLLAQDEDLRFADRSGSGGLSAPLPLDGLARMLYATETAAYGVEGFPPNLSAVISFRLTGPENPRADLLAALQKMPQLEILGQIAVAQRGLLARYDALAAELVLRRPFDQGGREQSHYLQSVINEMIALDILRDIVPLYEERWQNLEKVELELARARNLAPDNPLLLTALAETELQLDRPVKALEHVSRALTFTPEYAKAHDIRGMTLLRQRLPSLAAGAFGRAIALAPQNAAYLMHRASAYLVLEEKEAMCADFKAACGLGQCEGLQWSKGAELCVDGADK